MATLSLNPTLAEALLGNALIGREKRSLLVSLLLVVAGSCFIALSAQFAIRLPFSPVPITGQTFAVLVVGMAFGARLGAITVIAYLLEGLFLPVFSEARTWAHPATLWTIGYLFGFVIAAFTAGWLAEKGWDRKPTSTALAMLIGNVVIYVPGLLWLGYMFWVNTGITEMPLIATVFAKGFVPFIIGDGIKLVLATLALPLAWKWVQGQSK